MKRLLIITLALLFGKALSFSEALSYEDCYKGLPFETPVLTAPVIPELTVSLADFGGVGDGVTLNTEAFTKAINHLSAKGGGHLVVPEGVWMSGPIEMRSNIDLHLDFGAILLFSPDKSLYPILPADAGTGGAFCTAPIHADGQCNFSITGRGVIDGYGEAWRPVKRFKVSDAEWKQMSHLGLTEVEEGKSIVHYPTFGTVEGKPQTKRPRLLRFINCERFMVQGVTVQNSPSFHVNMILCRQFILDGITVRCPWNAQNGDGIDLSSCRGALLTGCQVDCGDDAICIKSGIGDTGRHRGPSADMVITGCTVYHGHGGFVIGSDTGGGMKRIAVRNCRFIDTDTGLRFKSGRDRGGLVTDIWVSDIVMCDIDEEAILFDCYYQEKVGDAADAPAAPVTPDTPVFKGIHIDNIVCTDAGRAILFKGLAEMPVADVTISNSVFNARRGAVINHTRGVTLSNVTLYLPDGEEKITSTDSDSLSLLP